MVLFKLCCDDPAFMGTSELNINRARLYQLEQQKIMEEKRKRIRAQENAAWRRQEEGEKMAEAEELERVKRAHAEKIMQQQQLRQQLQQQQQQKQQGPRVDKTTIAFKPSQVMEKDEGHLETKGQARIIRIKQLDDTSIAFRTAERTLAARGLPAPVGLALPRFVPEPFEPLSSFLEVVHQEEALAFGHPSTIYEENEDEGCEVNGEKQISAGIYLKSKLMQEEDDEPDSQGSPDVETYVSEESEASEDATIKLNSAWSGSLTASEFRNPLGDDRGSRE